MKTTKIKGFLIDPYLKTITETEIEKSGNLCLDAMKKAIRAPLVDCAQINDTNDVWVDDEGLFTPGVLFFSIHNPPQQILAGYGLVLGNNPSNGESSDSTLTLEQLKKDVKFYDARAAVIENSRIEEYNEPKP